MAVNPNYPEPDTSSSVPTTSQNPRYGEEPTLEEFEPGGPEELEEGPEKVDESLTHAELDRIAAERGVEFPPNLNKAEKIELLNSL